VESAIRSCTLFARLDPATLAELETLASPRRFRKGQLVLREGEHPAGIFVVVRGVLKVYQLGVNGKEHVLKLAREQDTIGEVAVMGEFPVPAFVEALEECECLLIPAMPFRALLDSDARISRLILAGIAMRVRHMIGMIEDIVLRDATARVARYLLSQSEADGEEAVRLPGLKKHVASHLNLTSETFSRTLRRLTEAGMIAETAGSTLQVVDRAALRMAAASAYPLY